MPTDIEIAQGIPLKPITEIAAAWGVPPESLDLYGNYKAKINPDFLENKPQKGKLILVTAISPTKAGEGKTTVSIGLAQALCALGKNAAAALREPSLGPVFGIKGGATGGGKAQVLPMEDINLHFTGDLHAVTAAHNLISAAVDNHIWQGNTLGFESVIWKRAMDMNDRALRDITLNDAKLNRKAAFQITAASEIMAVLCLAENLADLRARIGRITLGYTKNNTPLTVKDLGITGAVCTLLKDTLRPNLVQTAEHTPALIHGGPFANIAHGCNTVIATKAALKLADYVVTEAGFGADLGAEKFLHIKCRLANLNPRAVVLVATLRALKLHGDAQDYNKEDLPALCRGLEHLRQHADNLKKFGLPIVIAINRFVTDSSAEEAELGAFCQNFGLPFAFCSVWAEGGKGGKDLAEAVLKILEATPRDFTPLYSLDAPLKQKIETLAKEIYRAKGVQYSPQAEEDIARIEKTARGMPICISKTPLSFSDEPSLKGCPRDFFLKVQGVRLSTGAGFAVVQCGALLDMPGLPKTPSMLNIDIDDMGRISGTF